MWDNGAFTLHTKGKAVDWHKFYTWVEPRLGHPHWAVVPDVIDGDTKDNLALIAQWPYDRAMSAVVWHMGEPIEHLLSLVGLGFSKLCFGSSGAYWQVGSEAWERRCDEAFNALEVRGMRPWVHMLRGLAMCGDRYPFGSADSVNVARNYKDTSTCPERMARRIDSIQCPPKWKMRAQQMGLFE
ncbi:hypothetical protein UFOVP589_51 [uncultured Caudovirales phage]|uniref:Uncharacterized protein n=1 Tax=uncultured Caudovirales phage TaxID=2100421 RepID=A0A6J5N437_9CAUD|nr:hypothetical protein UFOVP589_51 [uncultured Caudovirales phage]